MISVKRKSSLQFKISCLLVYGLFIGTKITLHHFKHQKGTEELSDYPIYDSASSITEFTDDNSHLHRQLLGIRVVRPPPSFNCTPLAVENFPSDVFVQKQRQKGAVILHMFGAIYMFLGLAILCDDYFIPCLERICEVLRLQPDVAGATFMAAGSSAPELATTLVGVFIAKDDIGLGAVVGSADFNVMLVVSVTALFAKQVIYLNWWPLVRDCSFYLISIVLLALVILDEYVYWYEALVLLLFYVVYVAFMFFNPRMDRFWRIWCLEHPTCCPRAMHTEAEEQETRQQHSGAFGQVLSPAAMETDELHEDDTSTTRYERLVDHVKKPNEPVLDTVVGGGGDDFQVGIVSAKDMSNASLGDNNNLEAAGFEPMESWSATCFSTLRLPTSPGLAGKLLWLGSVSVLPIRSLLCLTIPDVRKPRWRRVPISHWIAFTMCCVWIGMFTVVMMWMITVIGVTFHIPDTIMGLTFIAAGSSVPDAIASVLVVREGEGDMAVSNAVGSNVFDILICMGLPWFLKCLTTGAPVIIYSKGLLYAVLTLFSTVIFLLVATHLNRWRLTKPYGVILLVGYFVVLLFCSCYELNLFGTVHLPECPLSELR